MTKKVRIENADNSSYGVCVQVWERHRTVTPDTLVSTTPLRNPTDLGEFYVHDSQYLLITEMERPAS